MKYTRLDVVPCIDGLTVRIAAFQAVSSRFGFDSRSMHVCFSFFYVMWRWCRTYRLSNEKSLFPASGASFSACQFDVGLQC